MRIIDADELIVFGIDDPENGGLFKFVPKEFIDQAPTIEAITVEYLESIEENHPVISIRQLIAGWRAEEESRTKIELTMDQETWDRLTEETSDETD